jgi:CreA protein
LIFKSLAVRRIYDKKNATLIYVVHSHQVKDASAKTGISMVPLYGIDVQSGRQQGAMITSCDVS